MEGAAPPGVIPSSFRNVAIAALVGPIPDRVALWIVDAETGRVVAARFAAVARELFMLPLVQEGQVCSEAAKVTKVEVEVVRATITAGTAREEVLVLAKEPHVVAGKDLRCIRLPGLVTTR